jgi:glycosyltransferase involved in cell wall biosynthesis
MNVLWVTEEVPDRSGAHGGGGVRQAHLLLALAQHHPTTLLVAGHVDDDGVRPAVAAVHEVDPGTPLSGRRAAIAVRLGHDPFDVVLHRRAREAIAARIDELAAGTDAVVLHHHALAPLLGRCGRAVRVLHQFHVPHVEAAELAARAAPDRKRLLRRNAEHAARLQRSAAARAEVLVAAAADDVPALVGGATPAPRVVVAPNGVDLERFTPAPLPASPRVLLSGTLHHPPNVDGAVWLALEVWPNVRAAIPDATLEIVGRGPVPEVLALHRPEAGVSVHADVDDVLTHLHRARVAAVPIRFGTGTRLKVLEAFAAGRPVVTTTVGVAGIGGHAMVRDDPAGFAEAVVTLLTDDSLASSLATAGRAHVESRFAWPAIGERFAEDLAASVDAAAAR